MEELKLIIELLGSVSIHALIGTVVYLVLSFFKAPMIVVSIGYVINTIFKNIQVVRKEKE